MSDSDSDLVVANYYDVLGLSENATEDEIRTTYKRLTVAYHPDKNTNERSNEKFLEIKDAYDTLIDPKKRSEYDHYRKEYERYKEQCQDQQSFMQWAGIALVGMGSFLAGYFVAKKATSKSNKQ